jgi:hypothetical protein
VSIASCVSFFDIDERSSIPSRRSDWKELLSNRMACATPKERQQFKSKKKEGTGGLILVIFA